MNADCPFVGVRVLVCISFFIFYSTSQYFSDQHQYMSLYFPCRGQMLICMSKQHVRWCYKQQINILYTFKPFYTKLLNFDPSENVCVLHCGGSQPLWPFHLSWIYWGGGDPGESNEASCEREPSWFGNFNCVKSSSVTTVRRPWRARMRTN